MSDFFQRLAERTLGKVVRVQPLISSRYSSQSEAQSLSGHRTEDSRDAAQPLTEFSNSVTPGIRQCHDSLQQDELQQDGASRSIPPRHAPVIDTRFRASLIAGLPATGSEREPGVSSTEIRRATVGPSTRAEIHSAKSTHWAIEQAAERLGEMSTEVPPASTPRDRIPVVTGTDAFLSDSDKLVSDSAVPHREISAQVERLPWRQSRIPLIPAGWPESAAREIVGDVVSQRATGQSIRSGESVHSSPDRPTARFDPDTSSIRMNSDRTPAEPPVIRVTIGRIEVRASVASKSPRPTPTQQPVMSLDDYLQRRQGGRE